MHDNLVLSVIVSGIVIFAVVLQIFYECSYLSVVRYCDTDEALLAWRLNNPELYVGDSSYGRSLVLEALDAYRNFLRYHPYCSGEEHIAFLLSLLDEHGPEPPRKPLPQTASKRGCFSLRGRVFAPHATISPCS